VDEEAEAGLRKPLRAGVVGVRELVGPGRGHADGGVLLAHGVAAPLRRLALGPRPGVVGVPSPREQQEGDQGHAGIKSRHHGWVAIRPRNATREERT
jgi:hypothetical protein